MRWNIARWMLVAVAVAIMGTAGCSPAPMYVTVRGAFYKLPSDGTGHDDLDSEIHVIQVAPSSSAPPRMAIVFQGNIWGTDTKDMSRLKINNMTIDCQAEVTAGGVYVVSPGGKLKPTNLTIGELTKAISAFTFEHGLTSDAFDAKCAPLLESLTKK